jgi:hypothetical protein
MSPSSSMRDANTFNSDSAQYMLDDYMKDLLDDSKRTPDKSLHMETLITGLKILLGEHPALIEKRQEWCDLVTYSRSVIFAPQDNSSRTESPWTRSTSAMSKEFLSRYGPGTIQAAKQGYQLLLALFEGESAKIPHIDKKAHFLRTVKHQIPGRAYYPYNSPLATITYETGNVACSIALLAWASPSQAAVGGMLTHHAICDDYHKFSSEEMKLRVRLVALGVGAAYAMGEKGPSAVLDGTLLQSKGTGKDESVYSALAWRAISGCSIPYTGALFGSADSVEEAVSPPMILIAIHDMLDWRSDTAGGNHENVVTAAYGMGYSDPFHAILETSLEIISKYPAQTLSFVASMSILHYTGTRYGSYQYTGHHKGPCEKCVAMLREATNAAGFEWSPQEPPRNFTDGAEARDKSKQLIDEQRDVGKVQEGLGWFQHILSSGEIWLFDILQDGVEHVDQDAGWV